MQGLLLEAGQPAPAPSNTPMAGNPRNLTRTPPTPGVHSPVTLKISGINREGRAQQANLVKRHDKNTCKISNRCNHVTEKPREHALRPRTADHYCLKKNRAANLHLALLLTLLNCIKRTTKKFLMSLLLSSSRPL